MKLVKPETYLIAKTGSVEYYNYLNSIGANNYQSNAPSDGEELIEFLGRLCYRSYEKGLNPNVTKVRSDNKDYITNLLRSGHGSVLECVSATFVFQNVSRVLTHELIRHRVGTAISQESLRYVRLEDIKFWIPSCFEQDEYAKSVIEKVVRTCEEAQIDLARHFKLDETADFTFKKTITSAMRRLAPEGLGTVMGWTANIRTLRHVIEMRTSRHAEEEIRLVFNQVAEICRNEWPNLFSDYNVEIVDGHGEWTTPNSKV